MDMLLREADRDGIEIIEEKKMPEALNGLSIETETKKTIVLRDELNPVKKREVLAHELGHQHVGCPNLISCPAARGQYEYRANYWAVKRLMPISRIISVYERGARDTWEFAEMLGVSDEFFCGGIRIYRAKHATGLRFREYRISFEPFIIEKENTL